MKSLERWIQFVHCIAFYSSATEALIICVRCNYNKADYMLLSIVTRLLQDAVLGRFCVQTKLYKALLWRITIKTIDDATESGIRQTFQESV